jgi:hypothetical protein
MRVAANPDTRFVDQRDYEKEADYVLNDRDEIPALVWHDAAQDSRIRRLRETC